MRVERLPGHTVFAEPQLGAPRELAGPRVFPEPRTYASAAQLLGYLEGRPGVRELLSALPLRAGLPRQARWTRGQRADMRERLEASPPAEYARDNRSDAAYERWVSNTLDVLEWADDGGVVAEAEVESDSGGET